MTRERLARLALRAYPKSVRRERGEEMLGTLLDSSLGSDAGYCRELLALLAGGLRARARVPARPTVGRVLADGSCYAGVGILALILAELVGTTVRYRLVAADATQLWRLLLIGGCLSAALLGYDRLAGAGALGWIALVIDAAYRAPDVGPLLAVEAVPVLCFVVMVMRPRRQPHRAHRIVWLAPIVALGIVAGGAGPDTYLLLTPLAIVVPLALARLDRDPRLAIAYSLFAAATAMFETAEALSDHAWALGLPLTLLLFSVAPLMIAFTVRRSRASAPGGVS